MTLLPEGFTSIYYTSNTCVNRTVLPETIAAMIGQTAVKAPAMREMARTSPATDNAADAAEALGEAAMRRIKEKGTESPRSKNLRLVQNTPDFAEDVFTKPNDFAAYYRIGDPKTREIQGGLITINPNSSRDLLAHELGHHVTDNTKVGHMVANLRQNPKLKNALAGAVLGLPFLQSALQEGDDDAASGVALAAALSSPILIDEALATKNGLAIMKDAGMKATPGQRGRLAGAYLSYAAAPLVAGLGGNVLGNVVDDYTAVYNIGEGELPM